MEVEHPIFYKGICDNKVFQTWVRNVRMHLHATPFACFVVNSSVTNLEIACVFFSKYFLNPNIYYRARILGNKKLAACTCTLQVFYTSIIIGKIIGRRFVFLYNRGAIVSMISFLISDHLLVFLSMIFSRWAATAFWASLIKSSDSRI